MMDERRQLFPLCVVWTVLPCIGWLLPVVGHAAICDEEGVIHEFLGNYINVGPSVFGSVAKFVPLAVESGAEYGAAVKRADGRFGELGHNLCCNNCHHHVACALNEMQYGGRADWDQFDVWWMCLRDSSYVSCGAVLRVYLPFLVILGVVLGLVFGLR